MKTKILILIAVSAVVTLSFTFASSKNESKEATTQSLTSENGTAPAGGFFFDEK